ncbi:MAG: CBS domain-containing protein [bacterium]|nr:CBS domain-containing protein [Gammaproteobacteria bacterium]
MDTVKEMLDIKGRDVWTIEASQSVYQAIELMAEKEVGALVVVDDSAHMTGIISERDYARKVILKNKSSKETTVAGIMTKDVVSVREETTIDKCMSLMSLNRIRHLPVVDGTDTVGLITVGDLLKLTIKEQSLAIEELESYIKDETGGSG